MDKYYTPEIEEFHVGFEYEWNNPNEDDEWRESIADSEDIYHIDVEMRRNRDLLQTRVKHLDREDIESLGWEFYHEHVVDDECKYLYFKMSDFIDLIYSYSKQDGIYVEIIDNEYSDNETWFIGKIKNKSELKRIMKMVELDD